MAPAMNPFVNNSTVAASSKNTETQPYRCEPPSDDEISELWLEDSDSDEEYFSAPESPTITKALFEAMTAAEPLAKQSATEAQQPTMALDVYPQRAAASVNISRRPVHAALAFGFDPPEPLTAYPTVHLTRTSHKPAIADDEVLTAQRALTRDAFAGTLWEGRLEMSDEEVLMAQRALTRDAFADTRWEGGLQQPDELVEKTQMDVFADVSARTHPEVTEEVFESLSDLVTCPAPFALEAQELEGDNEWPKYSELEGNNEFPEKKPEEAGGNETEVYEASGTATAIKPAGHFAGRPRPAPLAKTTSAASGPFATTKTASSASSPGVGKRESAATPAARKAATPKSDPVKGTQTKTRLSTARQTLSSNRRPSDKPPLRFRTEPLTPTAEKRLPPHLAGRGRRVSSRASVASSGPSTPTKAAAKTSAAGESAPYADVSESK